MFPVDPAAEASYLLMRHAGTDLWPDSADAQRRLLRRARAAVHPDRGATRAEWDAVEAAARTLGLASS